VLASGLQAFGDGDAARDLEIVELAAQAQIGVERQGRCR